jgi:hypothetical protein
LNNIHHSSTRTNSNECCEHWQLFEICKRQKFTDESKLSLSIKNQYPNHYGKMRIGNPSNPYYNLNKHQFINKIQTDLLDQAAEDGVLFNNEVVYYEDIYVIFFCQNIKL